MSQMWRSCSSTEEDYFCYFQRESEPALQDTQPGPVRGWSGTSVRGNRASDGEDGVWGRQVRQWELTISNTFIRSNLSARRILMHLVHPGGPNWRKVERFSLASLNTPTQLAPAHPNLWRGVGGSANKWLHINHV